MILVIVACGIAALPLAQKYMRRILKTHPPHANQFVALVETPLTNVLAYTADDLTRMYIDTNKFDEAPNSLWNVMRHEIAHTQGEKHEDGTPAMRYSVTVDANGAVVDDKYRI
jgi:hypothetical protein